MNLIEKRERNQNARIQLSEIVNKKMLRWDLISNKMGILPSNLSHWKNNKYDFGAEKLNKLEALIEKLEKMNI